MNYKYVLDSSAWVEYFLGTSKGEAITDIIEHELIATSIFAIVELADKFARDNKPFDTPLQFIQNRAAILPLTMPIALHAATLKKTLRPKHQKFGIADGIHLATAIQQQARLVTMDSDFSGVPHALLF